jgi:hypothetical protein
MPEVENQAITGFSDSLLLPAIIFWEMRLPKIGPLIIRSGEILLLFMKVYVFQHLLAIAYGVMRALVPAKMAVCGTFSAHRMVLTHTVW